MVVADFPVNSERICKQSVGLSTTSTRNGLDLHWVFLTDFFDFFYRFALIFRTNDFFERKEKYKK